MSRFFSQKYASLVPYTPGEQPRDQQYVKLNTNESPFPPSPRAVAMAREAAERLELYPDPDCTELAAAAAAYYGVTTEQVLFTNGSDDGLNFAFMAFCDEAHPAVFPEISYGFYPVFAELNHIPYERIPLQADFTVRVQDYVNVGKTVFLANPNAPTGIALCRDEIETIVRSNPDNVVVIDEAYVDFGAESAVPLIAKYDNLLVIQTFSKSRSMAGARLGFVLGDRELIRDLNTVRYSTNPYNINRMTMAAGIGALADDDYFRRNCRTIAETRAYTTEALRALGFTVLDSKANFIFAETDRMEGGELYRRLKQNGVLVRHFDTPILRNFNRITIGSREQMDILLAKLRLILEGAK